MVNLTLWKKSHLTKPGRDTAQLTLGEKGNWPLLACCTFWWLTPGCTIR